MGNHSSHWLPSSIDQNRIGQTRRDDRALTRSLFSEDSVSTQFKRRIDSNRFTYDFRAMLLHLDFATGTHRRVQWLEFWLAARTLQQLMNLGDIAAAHRHLKLMHRQFFRGQNPIILLSPRELQRECERTCAKGLTGRTYPVMIAQRDIGIQLDGYQKDFFWLTAADREAQVAQRMQQRSPRKQHNESGPKE